MHKKPLGFVFCFNLNWCWGTNEKLMTQDEKCQTEYISLSIYILYYELIYHICVVQEKYVKKKTWGKINAVVFIYAYMCNTYTPKIINYKVPWFVISYMCMSFEMRITVYCFTVKMSPKN